MKKQAIVLAAAMALSANVFAAGEVGGVAAGTGGAAGTGTLATGFAVGASNRRWCWYSNGSYCCGNLCCKQW